MNMHCLGDDTIQPACQDNIQTASALIRFPLSIKFSSTPTLFLWRWEWPALNERETDSRTGLVQKLTKPACTPGPATAVVSPS